MTISWNRSQDGHVTSKDGRWQIDPLCCGTPRPVFYELTDLLTGQKHGTTHQTQQSAKNEAQELMTDIQHRESSIQNPASSPQHGGPRTPGPGKKMGRPKKPAKDRAVTTTITLSSPKAAQTLKRKARKAKLTPGTLIERELHL